MFSGVEWSLYDIVYKGQNRIIERICDESWFQLSILNYEYYTFIKCIKSSIIFEFEDGFNT